MIRPHGLGRRRAPDERDRLYKIADVLPPVPPVRRYRYWWSEGTWLNQDEQPEDDYEGKKGFCVGYAWSHYLADGPVTQRVKADHGFALQVYDRAQDVDEWEGRAYAGTSVRAGAKVLQEMGYIRAYRWAWDIDTTIEALLTLGPLVVGTSWFEGMFEPDGEGFVRVEGRFAGGHAYVINGLSLSRGVVRCKNSWSRNWARNGHFYMGLEDMEILIRDGGEVCIAEEVKR